MKCPHCDHELELTDFPDPQLAAAAMTPLAMETLQYNMETANTAGATAQDKAVGAKSAQVTVEIAHGKPGQTLTVKHTGKVRVRDMATDALQARLKAIDKAKAMVAPDGGSKEPH